jgi:GNAT superfamily N-acetyltransferase
VMSPAGNVARHISSIELQPRHHRIPPQTKIKCLEIAPRADFHSILAPPNRASQRDRCGNALTAVGGVDRSTCARDEAVRAFGAFVGSRLLGLLKIYKGGAGHVEVALIVERRWQNKGVGWALLSAAMEWRRQSDTQSMRLIFSRNNWPMRAIARKAGAQFNLVFGEIHADIAIAPASTGRTEAEFDGAVTARQCPAGK